MVVDLDRPEPDVTYRFVAATDEGIVLVPPGVDEVHRIPIVTDTAYLAGAGNSHVVYAHPRGGAGGFDIVTQTAEGAATWQHGRGDETYIALLGAGTVDDRPMAVVSLAVGQGIEDREAEIVLLDLVSGETTLLGTWGQWEEGIDHAFFADGVVILRWASLGESRIHAVRYDGTPAWDVVIDDDSMLGPEIHVSAAGASAQTTSFVNVDGELLMRWSHLLSLIHI